MNLLNSRSRKHFFFEFTALFTHTTPELVLEIAVLGPKFCPACEWCSFTIHLASHSRGPHSYISAEPWIDCSDKTFMDSREVHFFMMRMIANTIKNATACLQKRENANV